MAERERGEYQGQLVTILSRKGRKLEIRTPHGFVIEVGAKEVKKLDAEDPRAKLKFEEVS